MAHAKYPFIVQSHGGGRFVLQSFDGVREAVRVAREKSRGGNFLCVHGPRTEPAEHGGTVFRTEATLGCFLNGRRSTLSLPEQHRQYLRSQNKRRGR